MRKVLSAAQMREVDRLTTERYGIPSIILMENAAHAVAGVITERLAGSVEDKSILVLCGKGNNGGDGAAVARILAENDAFVRVVLFGKVSETTGDARTNFEKIQEMASSGSVRMSFLEASIGQQCKDVNEWLGAARVSEADVLVDAIFGTGLSRSLNSFFSALTGNLGNLKREGKTRLVVSVDVPSGIDADQGEPPGESINAHITVTFTAPKPGNILPPASRFNGELIVCSIGSPQELIDEKPSQLFLAERNDVAEWLKRSEFSSDSFKNKRGHVLMIAGSRDFTGAAVLCGNAAIRSGVGLVTLAVPESSRESVVARVSPEVIVRGILETRNGSAAETAFKEVSDFSRNVDAIAVGSGLSSRDEGTKRFIKRVVEESKTPVLIDADGLTGLSPWNMKGSDERPLVLTPHEGEFRKLLGIEKEQAEVILKDRVGAVREFATRHNVFLVLKGERVLIGEPGGKVVVNPTGNSGVGKAGNGDTLTGILGGFVAQAVQMKIDIFETVVAAVYVAGMAGDMAEKKYGKRVMTASDVRECLAEVFSEFERK